ncbi:MAG: GerMN domain-containing protein [Treponemataceae bacterium]
MKKIIELKEKKIAVFLLIALAVIFLFSFIIFKLLGYSYHKEFIFQGMDKNVLYVESRYFPSNKNIDKIELYVSELLLGPIGNRYKNLFLPGTKLEFCFVKGKTLYVNLSKEALFPDENTSDIMYAVKIFKKNIFRNFGRIDKINLYIDGEKVIDS